MTNNEVNRLLKDHDDLMAVIARTREDFANLPPDTQDAILAKWLKNGEMPFDLFYTDVQLATTTNRLFNESYWFGA